MDSIDVRDLPEEKAEFVRKIVELFRREERAKMEKRKEPERINFLSRPMRDVRETVTRKEMHDF